MSTPPRIYVASLTDYNAGTLHGCWIDATQDAAAIYDEVKAMLAASPEARAFPAGGPAEEWAIHDYEGFGSWRLSEWEQFETVSKVAQAIEEHGEAFLAFLAANPFSNLDDPGAVDLDEAFSESYRGEWSSPEDYAYECCKELGWSDVPALVWPGPHSRDEDRINVFEELSSYIDWEKIARDLFQHGSYSFVTVEGSYKSYVFEDVDA